MYLIQNQNKETVAYIQNMMILDVAQEKVVGILIGDCFFGKNNKVVGKIELDKSFKNTAIKKSLMAQAWDILMNISEHTGAWIVDTKKWSKTELIKHLE